MERYAIRKRYWKFALPFIQDHFGKKGPFSNVNPSTSNWIAGSFGIGGFNVSCIANFDYSKVTIWLGKTNRDKNKEAYDLLYSHKNEIESSLSTHLIWERMDNNKSSGISIRLEGVSIANETDWTRMAKFHAEWSKELCDVILPYLAELYPMVELT